MKNTIDRTLRGVDVSTYQGSIDWRAAFSDGIRFAMIKATQGRSVSTSNLRNFRDSRFAENVVNASKGGIVCGAYHYLTALNETEAAEEAQVFLTEATEKLDTLDVEGINQTFSGIDEFVNSLDGIVTEAGGMVDTMNDVTEKLDAASKAFDPIIESLNNLKSKLSFF